MRIVVSFSLYFREKRVWLPLCLFVTTWAFLYDDSVEVVAGQFFRNDSVEVYNDYIKQSLSYAINVPEEVPRYRIYVRLAKDSIPSDSTFLDLANKVAALKELKFWYNQWTKLV